MAILGDVVVQNCEVGSFPVGGVTYLAARFDIEVLTDGPIQLAAIMDAIAAKVPAELTGRVYAWPVEDATPKCAIVAYPDQPIEFDVTLSRGSDRVTVPLFVLVGKPTERTARDAISAVITGQDSIKVALDGILNAVAS